MNLDDLRSFALSLPEVTEEPHFKFTSFRIGGKIFATVPPNDDYLHIFVDEQDRELAMVRDPNSCEKLWWGKKVVGLRVSVEKAKRKDVEGLLTLAWQRKAPKRLK